MPTTAERPAPAMEAFMEQELADARADIAALANLPYPTDHAAAGCSVWMRAC